MVAAASLRNLGGRLCVEFSMSIQTPQNTDARDLTIYALPPSNVLSRSRVAIRLEPGVATAVSCRAPYRIWGSCPNTCVAPRARVIGRDSAKTRNVSGGEKRGREGYYRSYVKGKQLVWNLVTPDKAARRTPNPIYVPD